MILSVGQNSVCVWGVARRFGEDGRFGTLGKDGFVPIDDHVERWVGTNGMSGIVKSLAQGVEVKQDPDNW